MSEIVRLKPTKKFFEIIERAKGDKDELARMMAEVRKEAFKPGFVLPQSDPLFEQEPKIEVQRHPVERSSLAIIEPIDANRIFSTQFVLSLPNVKNLLTEAEYGDFLKRRKEEILFHEELNEALAILGDGDYYNNVDIPQVFELADAQRQLNQMIKNGRVLPTELLKFAKHSENTGRQSQKTREDEAYSIAYERIYIYKTHSQKIAFDQMLKEESREVLSADDYFRQFESFKSAMKYRNKKNKR